MSEFEKDDTNMAAMLLVLKTSEVINDSLTMAAVDEAPAVAEAAAEAADEAPAAAEAAAEPVYPPTKKRRFDCTAAKENVADMFCTINNNIKDVKKITKDQITEFIAWKNDILDTGTTIKDSALAFINKASSDAATESTIIKSNVSGAFIKLKGKLESVVEKVGLKAALDDIMIQHEKMLFIALQSVAAKMKGDLLTPHSDDIPTTINNIMNSAEEDKRQIMIHVTKLFETFFYGKLSVSAVNSYNIIETDQGVSDTDMLFFNRSNAPLVKKINEDATDHIIKDNINSDNLIPFLVTLVSEFNKDDTAVDINHAKYFGSTASLKDFVKNEIDADSYNYIEHNLAKQTLLKRVDFYIPKINSGDSIGTDYIVKIRQIYDDYNSLIGETGEFINQAKSVDFDFKEGGNWVTEQNEASVILDNINKSINGEKEAFIQEFISKLIVNKQKKYAPQFEELLEKAPLAGGGRKRKTRVAANKKRKTQKKKRPSRKMKVSRKKTQKRRKKGSQKKSMKNRK